MIASRYVFALVLVPFCVGVASAQDNPLMQKVAAKIVDKYQKTPCADLIAKKQQPPSDELKKVMAMLKANPDLRTKFISMVAAPIANKMFDCGMIQ